MKKKLLSILLTTALIISMLPVSAFAATTADDRFPDEVFCKYIYNKYAGDDGVLSDEELAAVTELDVNSRHIKTLEGIENFPNLEVLYCNWNDLTELDVSNNTKLRELYCNVNNIKKLDVSDNPALKTLWCYENELTTLDIIGNPALLTASISYFGIQKNDGRISVSMTEEQLDYYNKKCAASSLNAGVEAFRPSRDP